MRRKPSLKTPAIWWLDLEVMANSRTINKLRGTDSCLLTRKMKQVLPSHGNSRLAVILCAAALIVLWGTATMAMTLNSPAFHQNGHIPSKYTCEGQDISPPLAWVGIPTGAKSLVLIVDDPDAPDPNAPKTVWVHWVVYNISVPAWRRRGCGAARSGRVWRRSPRRD